ncbi:MAG: hypothetical protein ABI432_04800 [Flavobacteriales bacterium]
MKRPSPIRTKGGQLTPRYEEQALVEKIRSRRYCADEIPYAHAGS